MPRIRSFFIGVGVIVWTSLLRVDVSLAFVRTTSSRQQKSSLSESISASHILLPVNPVGVLNSTTLHILDDLLLQRCHARVAEDYPVANKLLNQLESGDLLSKDGYSIRVTDVAKSKMDSYWSLFYTPTSKKIEGAIPPAEVLHLAHALLGMAASSENYSLEKKDEMVSAAKNRLRRWKRVQEKFDRIVNRGDGASAPLVLDGPAIESIQSSPDDFAYWIQVEGELLGRKAADAAFWFALAGVDDPELFDLLTRYCVKELRRVGEKAKAKRVVEMAQRMVAAGVKNHADFAGVVRECLQNKKDVWDPTSVLDFHSDRCAMMIWNFSTRQRKQRSFLSKATNHWKRIDKIGYQSQQDALQVSYDSDESGKRISSLFEDGSRPLVIDVGCGMGLTVLGLASSTSSDFEHHHQDDQCKDSFDFSSCNFLGVDLNELAVGYAKGLTKRWSLNDRAVFVADAAENLLWRVQSSYDGPVSRILIQFPTPYRLSTEGEGNTQLPTSADDGFMVTQSLLRLAHDLLAKDSGELLLQSNCEDVALHLKAEASRQNFLPRIFDYNSFVSETSSEPTQRTTTWLAAQGDDVERAIGPEWSSSPILPRFAMAETEIACIRKRTPVHRCILVARRG